MIPMPLPPVARGPMPLPPTALRGPIPLPPVARGPMPLPPLPVPVSSVGELVRERTAMDIECYRDYFLVKFTRVHDRQVIGEFEMFPGQRLDVAAIELLLHRVTIYTFNGRNYDAPMLAAALAGYDNAQLKFLSDQIITQNLKPWDIERNFKIYVPAYIDHIDIIEILQGQHGLKMYMAKMHSKRIQELPIDPAASILPEMRPLMRQYCGNDNDGTIDAVIKFDKEIKLREAMSREYGIDLRSKSDAQIAEAVIKHELGFKVDPPEWAAGTWFNFDPPAYIRYRTPTLCALLETVRNVRFHIGLNAVLLPAELDIKITPAANIHIGNTVYSIGLGGLHSQESSTYHYSDAENELVDIDVESYYPRLMLNSGYWPPQIGEIFRTIFDRIVERRIAAKHAGDKATADSLKIVINGVFGKLLAKYGILSAPKFGVQTTVGGQLSILMLIESLELAGIPVVSANTDGIVVKCPRRLIPLRKQIVAEWEQCSGLKTEANVYLAIYSRDVNSYIAIKAPTEKEPNPVPKLKGEYAPPVPVASSWPHPTGEVCVDAIVAFLINGVPIEQTIFACKDVRKFVYVRNVKGGGVKYYGNEVEAVSTKGGMRAALAQTGWVEIEKEIFNDAKLGTLHPGPLPMVAAYRLALQELRDRNPVRKEYVGKVVRWYYAQDEIGAIRYKTNGNLVAKTEGAKPLMELPDELPSDIDYGWYLRETQSMLRDLGLK